MYMHSVEGMKNEIFLLIYLLLSVLFVSFSFATSSFKRKQTNFYNIDNSFFNSLYLSLTLSLTQLFFYFYLSLSFPLSLCLSLEICLGYWVYMSTKPSVVQVNPLH